MERRGILLSVRVTSSLLSKDVHEYRTPQSLHRAECTQQLIYVVPVQGPHIPEAELLEED